MADIEDTAESPHLEDLADRIRPRAASNLLLWAILGFVVIFVIWAAFTELDRTVRGQGRIIASSQLQVVSNLEGGIVEAILVRTGQQVREGQELVRRIIIVEAGRIVADGPRDEILKRITRSKAA